MKRRAQSPKRIFSGLPSIPLCEKTTTGGGCCACFPAAALSPLPPLPPGRCWLGCGAGGCWWLCARRAVRAWRWWGFAAGAGRGGAGGAGGLLVLLLVLVLLVVLVLLLVLLLLLAGWWGAAGAGGSGSLLLVLMKDLKAGRDAVAAAAAWRWIYMRVLSLCSLRH